MFALCHNVNDYLLFINSSSSWQWPFFYVTAGGLRLLMTSGEEDNDKGDDTFMLIVSNYMDSIH